MSAPGALFYLGDGHAVQGDGEIVGTGIETSFEIEFTVRVRKGRRIGWPRGETADFIFTVGNARLLGQALQHATTEMLNWLAADFGLDAIAGSHLPARPTGIAGAQVTDEQNIVSGRLCLRLTPVPLTNGEPKNGGLSDRRVR